MEKKIQKLKAKIKDLKTSILDEQDNQEKKKMEDNLMVLENELKELEELEEKEGGDFDGIKDQLEKLEKGKKNIYIFLCILTILLIVVFFFNPTKRNNEEQDRRIANLETVVNDHNNNINSLNEKIEGILKTIYDLEVLAKTNASDLINLSERVTEMNRYKKSTPKQEVKPEPVKPEPEKKQAEKTKETKKKKKKGFDFDFNFDF